MHSLHELQRQFTELMIAPATAREHSHDCVGFDLAPSPRARIYRNSVLETLRGALAAAYPVVKQLVGEVYFNTLADRYLRAFPSISGNIQDFGGVLAAFIDSLTELHELPYLGDVARLEWQIQESCRAADVPRGNLQTLAEVPVERYSDLCFTLSPSARLLCSSYPVLKIWQSNQNSMEPEETIALDEGGELLLIIRHGNDIEIERLSPGEFALLCQLEQGHSMEYSIEKGLAAEPDMDLAHVLRQHLVQQSIIVARQNERDAECFAEIDFHRIAQPGLSA